MAVPPQPRGTAGAWLSLSSSAPDVLFIRLAWGVFDDVDDVHQHARWKGELTSEVWLQGGTGALPSTCEGSGRKRLQGETAWFAGIPSPFKLCWSGLLRAVLVCNHFHMLLRSPSSACQQTVGLSSPSGSG
jgi:hypothetical protein